MQRSLESVNPEDLTKALNEDELQRCIKVVFLREADSGGIQSPAVCALQKLRACIPGFQIALCQTVDHVLAGITTRVCPLRLVGAIWMTPCQRERFERYGDVFFFDGKGRVNEVLLLLLCGIDSVEGIFSFCPNSY